MNETYTEFTKKIYGHLKNLKIPNIDILLSNLKSIANFDIITSSFFILDYRTQEFLYISPNVEQVLGYTDQELYKIGPIKMMDLFHPSDSAVIIEKLFVEGNRAIKKIPKAFIKKLKISFTFRLYQKDGSIQHFKKQFMPILLDNEKNVLVIMGTETKIEKENTDIISEINYQMPFGKWISVHKKTYLTEIKSKIPLGLKELEIVKLVSEGFSTKEIASLTEKSIETIKTQRKKIISKTKTQSMTDAVVHALKKKWI